MAWLVRRKCIDMRQEFKIDLEEESDWLDSITVSNQKNYQIWHHRKFVSELTKDYIRELNIIREVFIEEPKNYHAWCHRIWLVRRFDLYLQDFEFTKKMLDRDLRNNSAWNYKFFLVSSCHEISLKVKTKSSCGETIENIEKAIESYIEKISLENEVEFSIEYMLKDTDNESVYSYIRGLYDNENINNDKKLMSESKFLIQNINEVIKINPNCYQAKSFKLDLMIEEKNILSKNLEDLNKTNDTNQINKVENYKTKIVALESEIIIKFEELKEIDYIREKYWLWRKDNFQTTLIKL
jgi:PKD repeat protein